MWASRPTHGFWRRGRRQYSRSGERRYRSSQFADRFLAGPIKPAEWVGLYPLLIHCPPNTLLVRAVSASRSGRSKNRTSTNGGAIPLNCHPERSVAESKDLRLGMFVARVGEHNPKPAIRNLPPTPRAPSIRFCFVEWVGNHKPQSINLHPPQMGVPHSCDALVVQGRGKAQPQSSHPESPTNAPVPHPFDFVLSNGWETASSDHDGGTEEKGSG